MPLESSVLEKINQRVFRDYPEMHGARPAVSASGSQYTLVYKAKVQTPAGTMARVVRVTADEHGRIIKLSTSK
jgi:hypothetical protein